MLTRLIKPSAEYEASHVSYVAELRDLGEEFVPWVLAKAGDDFRAYLTYLEEQAQGIGLDPGFVPSSTFWLVDSAEDIVAVSNLRHALTESLLTFGGHIGFGVRPSARRQGYATETLRRTLIEARTLGIEDVLVTCDRSNIASANAILRNGGEYSGEDYIEAHSSIVQRYWIRGS